MERLTWFTGSRGLTNLQDPIEGGYDKETGVVDGKICYNIDFSRNGRISRRKGWQYTDMVDSCHSLFSDGGETLMVTGDALSILGSDYSYTQLRNVTVGARMSYQQVGSKVYYTNGAEYGYVLGGKSVSWTGPNVSAVKDSTKNYSGPLQGRMLGYHNGRMYIIQGHIAWYSGAYDVNTYNLAGDYLPFESEVTMFKSVLEGIWVGTSKRVAFLRGTGPENFRYEKKGLFGAIKGTAVEVNCSEVLDGSAPGIGVVFVSKRGMYLGTQDGRLVPLTSRRLKLPTVSEGASLCMDERFITSLGMAGETSKLTLNMRMDTAAFGQYLNYNFNSFCRHGDDLVGANSGGVFKLDATQRDESDSGTKTDISAKYESFLTDFGLKTDKRIRKCRVALETTGQVQLTFAGNETKTVVQERVPFNSESKEHYCEVPCGRDLKARFFSFTVENVKGADFSIDDIEAFVNVLLRKPEREGAN